MNSENYLNSLIWINCTLKSVSFGNQNFFRIEDNLIIIILYRNLFYLVNGDQFQRNSIALFNFLIFIYSIGFINLLKCYSTIMILCKFMSIQQISSKNMNLKNYLDIYICKDIISVENNEYVLFNNLSFQDIYSLSNHRYFS